MTLRAIILVMATLFFNNAWAGDGPSQRQSIGPSPSGMAPFRDDGTSHLRQVVAPHNLPSEQNLSSHISQSAIRIQNTGNQTLSFSFWNGEAAWKTVTVAAGQSFDVDCQKCGTTIRLAYHNGKENTQVEVKLGSLYALSWSQSRGVWELAGPLVAGGS